MPWTTPGTATAGEVLPASFWNTQVRDNSLHLYNAEANVKSATLSNVTTTITSTGSFADITGLSISITPSASSSLVLVTWSVNVGPDNSNDVLLQLVRASTAIGIGSGSTINASNMVAGSAFSAGQNTMVCLSGNFLDSPATTSATTYKLQGRVTGGTARLNRRVLNTDYSAISTITVAEILV